MAGELPLRKFSETFFKDKTANDLAQIPAGSATVAVYKQGATASAGATVTTAVGGVAVSVYDVGSMIVNDTVQLGTDASKQMIVEEITSNTSIKLRSTIGSSITVSTNDRFVVYSDLPTLYTEPSATNTKANPTSTNARGLVELYTKQLFFDIIVSGNGLTAQLHIDNLGGPDSRLYNVKDYGAVGNGSTDDAEAINKAIRAAEAGGGALLFPASPAAYVSAAGGHVLKRTTHIYGYGAILKTTSATATLLKFGSGASSSWIPGGITGLTLQGNGGGADTSIGLQVGNGTADAHGLAFRDMQITAFGHGVVLSGNGNCYMSTFSGLHILNNLYTGVRIDTTASLELISFDNCYILNNGQTQATGAAILYSANSRADLCFNHCTINSGGNGTLALLDSPSTAIANVRMENCSMEQQTIDSTLIRVLGTLVDKVTLVNTFLNKYNVSNATKPLIITANAFVRLVNCFLVAPWGSTVYPMINLGNSQTGVVNVFTGNGNLFQASGTIANAKILDVTGQGPLTFLDVSGSIFNDFHTSAALITTPGEVTGTHDFVIPTGPANNLRGSGTRVFTDVYFQDEQLADKAFIDTSGLAGTAATRSFKMKVTDTKGHWETPVVSTANLPAAGAAQDGKLIIEDVAPGRLVFYRGGLRYFIAGTAF